MESSAIGFGKGGPVPQRAGEIFAQACAEFASEGARLLQSAVEVVRADRHPEGFQLAGRPAVSSLTSTKSRVFVTSTSRYRPQ